MCIGIIVDRFGLLMMIVIWLCWVMLSWNIVKVVMLMLCSGIGECVISL